MEPTFTDTLLLAREQANRQIPDGRERAIVIRCIEDALVRSWSAGNIPPLEAPPKPAPKPPVSPP